MSSPIYGNYAITKELGRGGMGVVYVAENQLGKKKAIKILLPEWSRNEGVVKRFFAEAYAAARIDHPNIIEVEDLAQLPTGEYFLVMELLDGQPLDELIQRGPLALHDMLIIMVQVCAALAACHQHTIVHRDLKPANLFVVADNKHPHLFTKVLDFGIAKLADENLSSHTQTGAVIGTPSYMSPEQARGISDQIDARTDVYALGVILYELATGRQPYQGGSLGAIAVEQVHMQLPDPRSLRPDLPDHWVATIRDALAYQREARVQSARDLAYRLIEGTEGGWQIARQCAREYGEVDVHGRATIRSALDAALARPLWPPSGAASHQATAVLRPSHGGKLQSSVSIPSSPMSPTTMSGSGVVAMVTTPSPKSRSARVPWMLAAAVVVAAGVASLMVLRRSQDVAPAREAPPAVQAATQDAAVLEQRADAALAVTIQITTEPSGASVAVDGVLKGAAPLNVDFSASSANVLVTARLPGYETAEQRLDRSQGPTFNIVLRAVEVATAHTTTEIAKSSAVGRRPVQKKTTSPKKVTKGAATPIPKKGSGAGDRAISPDDVGGD